MKLAVTIFLASFVVACTPKAKESSAGLTAGETTDNSGEVTGDTAVVEGVVEQKDTDNFVDEIDVNDWTTFEAQNTAATNLLLTQAVTAPSSEQVAIYKLTKDTNGAHNFLPETSVSLSPDNTFVFKVQAYTYYVVKYKSLTGFVPALAKDTVLNLVLNYESSIAVNLFIRMVQTQDGKDLVDAKKVNAAVLEVLATTINAPGITDYKAVINSVLDSTLAQQKAIGTDQKQTPLEIAKIVKTIIDSATNSGTLSNETKSILKDAVAEQVQKAGTTAVPNSSGPSIPVATVGFAASPTSTTSISLTWTDAVDDSNGYKIAFQTGATAPSTCTAGMTTTAAANSGSKLITGLNPGTQYSFTICTSSSTSGDSLPAVGISMSTIPAAPLVSLNVDSSSQMTVSWSAVPGDTGGYKIAYRLGSSAPVDCNANTIATAVPGATNIVITGLSANSQYTFIACTINSSSGQSVASSSVSAATSASGLIKKVRPLAEVPGGAWDVKTVGDIDDLVSQPAAGDGLLARTKASPDDQEWTLSNPVEAGTISSAKIWLYAACTTASICRINSVELKLNGVWYPVSGTPVSSMTPGFAWYSFNVTGLSGELANSLPQIRLNVNGNSTEFFELDVAYVELAYSVTSPLIFTEAGSLTEINPSVGNQFCVGNWGGLANAKTSLDSSGVATSDDCHSSDDDSYYALKFTDFASKRKIPSSAVIDGIEAKCRWRNNGSGNDNTGANLSLVKTGATAGTSKFAFFSNSSLALSSAFGGSSDLWGTTVTADQFNANDFGIQVELSPEGNETVVYVDYCQIKVWFH
jgi:hypothetical protein